MVIDFGVEMERGLLLRRVMFSQTAEYEFFFGDCLR